MFQQITLQDIDQEWAWSQLVGRSISVGKRFKYCSPLRSDSKPGVWFEWSEDRLLIVDFADKSNSGITCVTAWSRIKGIHWKKALQEIYEKQGVRVIKRVEIKEVKKESKEIQITPCWDKEHKDYWKKRGLTKPENVFGVCAFTIISEKSTRTYMCDTLCFAYLCNTKYKLYFPFEKKTKKFLGNQTKNDLWLFNKDSKILIVSKSHKDALVIQDNCDYDVTHVQGENFGHPDKCVTNQWIEKYDKIFIWMDADRAGKEGANRLQKHIESEKVFLIFTPEELECKDADDIVVKHGRQKLKETIKKLIKKEDR